MEEYEAVGGSTGKITGRLKKFMEGTIFSKEAPLIEIEKRINAAVVEYTVAVSGAQFSVPEVERYENLFPSTNQRKQVNFANLNALERTILVTQDVFYKGKIGAENYEALFGSSFDTSEEEEDEFDLSNVSLEDLSKFAGEETEQTEETPVEEETTPFGPTQTTKKSFTTIPSFEPISLDDLFGNFNF